MATSYTPCEGSGLSATRTRVIRGAEGKFFHMNGRTYGHCPACDRSLNLGKISAATAATPRHKAA